MGGFHEGREVQLKGEEITQAGQWEGGCQGKDQITRGKGQPKRRDELYKGKDNPSTHSVLTLGCMIDSTFIHTIAPMFVFLPAEL